MVSKSQGINISFPISEREKIAHRVRDLKLPARGGMSLYFQMLRDYDQFFNLVPHYHKSDGRLHFYAEQREAARFVAPEEGPPQPSEEQRGTEENFTGRTYL